MNNSDPDSEDIKGKSPVNKDRETRMVWNKGKRVRHQDLPFQEHYEENRLI